MGSFVHRWRTRLSSRLAIAFFVPAAAAAALAATVAFVEGRSALRESAYQRLDAATEVRAAQFDRWVEEQSGDLRFVAALPRLRNAARIRAPGDDTSRALGMLLRRSVDLQGDFTRIMLLSAVGGQVIAASDSATAHDYRVTEQYFLEGRSHLVVQRIYPSPITGRPTLTIALPIRDADGRTLAVLAGEANLARVEALMSERAGLGETGEAYLVDRFHAFVRANRYGRLAFPRGVHSEAIDAALRGNSGSGVYRNYEGREVIGAYRWLPRQQLALFAEMDTREAFAPARRLAWVVLGTGLLSAIALAWGITLVARSIARPVREIADAAQAVAEGDLTASAPVRTHDEIGRLATAFNVMTARLRTLYGELEEQLLATRRAASESEESRRLLRAVIDHLPAVVAVKDLDGHYVMVNEAFSAVNDLAPGAALGRLASDVLPDHLVEGIVLGDAEALGPSGESAREETVIVRGEERAFLISRFPLRDAAGTAYALCVVATDVTERRRLQNQVLHQQKIEAVGRLAGGIAHDINNLLTAVRCNAELLLDGMTPDDPSRVHLEEIDRSVRNGAALTRQLLTFSRAHVVRASAVDLNRILGGMAAMLRRYVGTGIDMQFQLSGEPWMVHADEGQMEQVLLNLLSNAHDAMPGGGIATVTTANVVVGPSSVAVPDLPPGEYVRLSVADTGTGIEPDIVALLFEPFFTTKEAGRGTGLGLSTAFAIVRQANGAIRVETSLGEGSTFSVYLPRHIEDHPVVLPPLETTLAATAGTTLLVVDDEPAIRVSLRRMLVRHGYQIIEAESGIDALAQFAVHRDRIALVLTDVFMPGMSGQELARRLTELSAELPVVFMSGYTADEVVRRGLMHASTHFVQKPFERQALVALLEDVLSHRPAPASPG